MPDSWPPAICHAHAHAHAMLMLRPRTHHCPLPAAAPARPEADSVHPPAADHRDVMGGGSDPDQSHRHRLLLRQPSCCADSFTTAVFSSQQHPHHIAKLYNTRLYFMPPITRASLAHGSIVPAGLQLAGLPARGEDGGQMQEQLHQK